MNIVHLSHQDAGGGAAVAAARLHRGLRAIGVNSSMIVGRKYGTDPSVTGCLTPWRARVLKHLDRLPRKFLRTSNQSLISSSWVGSSAWKSANQRHPDIAHLHWVCEGFLRIDALRRLQAPVAWTLHDMWALAGGEHYVADCTRYKEGYWATNRPASESGFDLNRWVWRRKTLAWSPLLPLTIFAVSRWMAERARESVLFRERPIEVLHNGLDPEEFKPQDRRLARAALHLPPTARLVLFGALEATSDRRKGFDLLTDALGRLRHRTSALELVVFGAAPAAGEENRVTAGFKTHYLGRIDEAARLALVYAACDVMVVPSREEAFGQTALESLACGTPVAAFRIGGLPDIVEHRISGFLAEPFDTAELARGIEWILDRGGAEEGHRLAEAGRVRVQGNFTLAIQAARCRELYGRMLERHR